MNDSDPIAHEEDLRGYFDLGSKPRERWGVGVEYERLGVFRDTGRAVPYEGHVSIESMLRTLVRDAGWEAEEEGGHILALRRGATRLTLEPGAQVELSSAVHRTLPSLDEELRGFVDLLETASRPFGFTFIGLGVQPISPLDEIGWLPKKRYAIMRDYLPKRGARAHVMMKQTAGIQVNLDYGSEGDAADKLRTAMALSPLLTALYANSPLTDGQLNGFLSWRAWAWRETDPDRCGLLPFVFKDGAGFGDYLDYALDVPMFFVVRNDQWMPANGLTFRRFLRRGFEGHRATRADFELHLSTLFPEVRLKHYIEIRSVDSGEPASALALAALLKGILYDGASRRAAWELVRDMSFKDRERLLDEVCRRGPAARVVLQGGRHEAPGKGGVIVRDLLLEIVRLARQGLNNQGAPVEEAYLDLLDRRLGGEGGCPGFRLAADWTGAFKQDPRRLVEALAPPLPGPG